MPASKSWEQLSLTDSKKMGFRFFICKGLIYANDPDKKEIHSSPEHQENNTALKILWFNPMKTVLYFWPSKL